MVCFGGLLFAEVHPRVTETELTDRFFCEPRLLSLPDCLCNFPLLVLIYNYASVGASCNLSDLCKYFVFDLEMSELGLSVCCRDMPQTCQAEGGKIILVVCSSRNLLCQWNLALEHLFCTRFATACFVTSYLWKLFCFWSYFLQNLFSIVNRQCKCLELLPLCLTKWMRRCPEGALNIQFLLRS